MNVLLLLHAFIFKKNLIELRANHYTSTGENIAIILTPSVFIPPQKIKHLF